jgi:hypothetical protein
LSADSIVKHQAFSHFHLYLPGTHLPFKNELSQNFIRINNMKFAGTVMKTVTGVIILKALLSALLHNNS